MQHSSQLLYQKNGLTTIYLSKKLLVKKVGDRLDKIVDISNAMNVGRGTVQKAIKYLEDINAIALDTRGHLGSFITDINYSTLFEISGISHIVGVMPLPYSKRYEGLATGIYQTLNNADCIPASLAFMPGSEQRINSLKEGRYNFAVVSRDTAEYYIHNDENIFAMYTLNEHTYVNNHALICRADFNGEYNGMRVGVDNFSFDQLSMTTSFFENIAIELVQIKYSNIIENIKNNNIDAAIWSLEDKIENDPDLKYVILNHSNGANNTKATILVRKDDEGTQNYLQHFFDCDKVEQIQKSVLKNELSPCY